jgi:hypothetical protein
VEQLIIAAAPVVDARTHLVSDDAQHWNTPNTIPPLVMRSKKLTLVQAFQQAAPNSDRLSPAPSRVMPCEADGAIFGIAGVTSQHKQDATDLFATRDTDSAKHFKAASCWTNEKTASTLGFDGVSHEIISMSRSSSRSCLERTNMAKINAKAGPSAQIP